MDQPGNNMKPQEKNKERKKESERHHANYIRE